MAEENQQQSPLKGIHFVFEMGLRKVDEQMQIIKDIDSKMGILIGFIGTFVALLVGFFLGAESTKILTIHRGWTPVFFYGFLLFLLLALVRCFQAFRVRDYFAAYHFPPMVEWANEDPALIKHAFVGGVLTAVERNFEEIGRKRQYASQGTWLILFAIVLLFFVLVSLVVEGNHDESKAGAQSSTPRTESTTTAAKQALHTSTWTGSREDPQGTSPSTARWASAASPDDTWSLDSTQNKQPNRLVSCVRLATRWSQGEWPSLAVQISPHRHDRVSPER